MFGFHRCTKYRLDQEETFYFLNDWKKFYCDPYDTPEFAFYSHGKMSENHSVYPI